MDAFKSAPTPVAVQLDSVPQGASARTTAGQTCTTPCTLQVVAETPFSVTFSLDKHQDQIVEVNVIRNPGDFTTPATTVIDPNPVVAELAPIAPAKKRRAPAKRAAAPAPASTQSIVAPEPASPFPTPTR